MKAIAEVAESMDTRKQIVDQKRGKDSVAKVEAMIRWTSEMSTHLQQFRLITDKAQLVQASVRMAVTFQV